MDKINFGVLKEMPSKIILFLAEKTIKIILFL
jgi:hypothetical protein